MARYSAFEDDFNTIVFFLDFQWHEHNLRCVGELKSELQVNVVCIGLEFG